jgi:hypothetical protein
MTPPVRPISITETLKNSRSSFTRNGPLMDALQYLDSISEQLSSVIGKEKNKAMEDEIIHTLLSFETEAKEQHFPWRFVIDFSVEKDKYKTPVVQFCSGAPRYDRYVISFNESCEKRLEVGCVDARPDLDCILGGVSGEQKRQQISLGTIKRCYDEAMIQRIAICGVARVFPYSTRLDELELKSRLTLTEQEKKEFDKLKWHRQYTARAQTELDGFLGLMAHEHARYTTVNGGWAGIHEGSLGMTMISNLVGAVHSGEEERFYPPITVMPAGGSHDRVVTMADHYNPLRIGETVIPITTIPGVELETAAATYFEIPGAWGDDSKYLAGISTSLLVFEPYGYWTNIEIANGVAQGKPVAIIADPEKLRKGEYLEAQQDGSIGKRANDHIKMMAPDGRELYRVYEHAVDAARYMNDLWQQKLRIKRPAGLPSSYEHVSRHRLVSKPTPHSDPIHGVRRVPPPAPPSDAVHERRHFGGGIRRPSAPNVGGGNDEPSPEVRGPKM